MQATTTANIERVRNVPLKQRIADAAPTYGALAALVLLLIFNSLFTPNFFAASNFLNILLQVAATVLVAIGMTLVIATGGIDLSVGSVMAISSAIAATQLTRGVLPAIGLALVASLLIGALNGWIISSFQIQPIIVTLALLITGRGLAQVINDGKLIAFSNPAFEYLGKGFIGFLPIQVVIMLAVVALAFFAMRATAFGRYVLATGGNEAAARLAGVRTTRTKIKVYAVCSLLAGLAGLIEAARISASDAGKIGLNMELDAIAAVVVGGTPLTGGRATMAGTLIGALIMAIITASFNMLNYPYSWSLVLKALIILIAVYIQRPKVS